MAKTGKVDDLPDAYRGREQTYIKHVILRRYLERVARITLSRFNDFVFVDGFSGPWAANSAEYADTSFGIAIHQLRKVRDEMKEQRMQRTVRCIFVEKMTSAFKKLDKAVSDASDLPSLAINGSVEDSVDVIKAQIGNAFALISIDPKG